MLKKSMLLTLISLFVSCGSVSENHSLPPRWMDINDAMEELKDNIKPVKRASKAGWATYPVKEAKTLAQIFKDMEQLDEVKNHQAEFKKLLKNSQKLSNDFAAAISASPKNNDAIGKALKAVGRSCKTCHDKYRED